MGGFCGVISEQDCVSDLFFGTDYHSHLGTHRGGMAVLGPKGFQRSIHNIQNSPFRSKFEHDISRFEGRTGIGVISDTDPQPLVMCSRLGTFAIATVGVAMALFVTAVWLVMIAVVAVMEKREKEIGNRK